MTCRRIITAFLFLGILIGLSSCGKKAPPFLPAKEVFDTRVSDLQGEWEGGYALLRGGVPGPKEATDRLEGCRVYYGRYSADNPPCDGCPIEYQGHYEFGRETIEAGALFCKVPAETKDRIYFFRVHLVGPKGILGPPSKTVWVDAK